MMGCNKTAAGNDLNAGIIGINLQLFGEHLFTELVNLLLCFFKLLCQLSAFTLEAIYRLLHVRLLLGFLRKDLLITLQMALALYKGHPTSLAISRPRSRVSRALESNF